MNERMRWLGWVLAASLPAMVQAQPDVDAGLGVQDAWIRQAPPGAPVMAGFLVLIDRGDQGQVVTGAHSETFGSIEMHEMRMVDGIMRMRPVERIEVPAGGQVSLAPGGLHLMLFEPAAALEVGARVTITLERAGGRAVPVEFEVRALAGAARPAH